MYAIRSYYDGGIPLSEPEERAIEDLFLPVLETLARLPRVLAHRDVITSYSIHYTKLYENNPFWFNEAPTLDHLRLLLFDTHYIQYLLNTFWVGIAVVAITLVTAVPAAYSLTRWARGWGETMGIGIFLTYLVPPTILFIPLFV